MKSEKKKQGCKQSTACRTSCFKGVTKHRRSGRYEAHIWVKEMHRQVYLGGFETEDLAAEAHDIASIKCHGKTAKTNFDTDRYTEMLPLVDGMSVQELILTVRRQSCAFSRGSSAYRGVTKHPASGRWEARVGIPGCRHVFLGLFSVQEEAARAYDAALELLEADLDLTKLVRAADLNGKLDKKTSISIERWLRAGHCESTQMELSDAVRDGNVERAMIKKALGQSSQHGMMCGGEPYEAKEPIASPFAVQWDARRA
ncbi:hypothetical protein WJX73_006809 [Symbiochloris irregularis]|uniref:AP2/ERF domain-containing protein n=1 Tax=Symbiochloris irregularis TaxID=706552 RepID=A0AAW1NZY0_9CHLO